jgi:hypothetical protein
MTVSKTKAKLAEDQYEVEKKKSGELGNQDNILKLQGKSDKEILAIKIKQQKAEIDKGLTVVKNLEIERKLAIENAKYYRDIFVKLANIGVEISLTSLRILTKPIDLMIKTANAVSEKLGFGKITDFSIDNAIDKVKNWGVQSVADLLFDVNQTELTDKINKYKNDILKTQNDLAGNILSSRATDKTTTKTTKKADGSLSDEQLISLENEKNYAMLQLANFKDSEAAKIDVAKLAEENMTMKAIEQANLRMQIAEIEAQQRKASIMAVADAFGAASEIIGQETAVGKGLAIAQAIMNTYLGVTEALRQKSTLPSPFDVVAKVANVATVIATGLKAVKQITAVKVGSRGGGGGGAPSMGGVSASTPTPQFNVAGDAGVNQIASTLANQPPVKAYVVAKEVSTQQSLDRNIVKNATLG